METVQITTQTRCAMIDITSQVARVVEASGVQSGLCLVASPHTTAGIAVQEGYDPDVATDALDVLNRLVPHKGHYRHAEGNTDAHVKSMLTGVSQTLPVEYGRLQLGRWQKVFFCEFDGPRSRTIHVQVMGD